MAVIKGHNVRTNAVISFINQFTILALGLILPRLTLVSYGSETNGLVNTITQIFTYVALLEAGIGNAAVNALYKPIVNNDHQTISNVFSAAKSYYRKVTWIYGACVLVLTFFYPLFVDTELSYVTVALVVLLQGMSGVVNFYFTAAYRQLLVADGKYFIVSTIGLIVYVLSSVGKILLMSIGFNIVVLQVWNFVVICLQACALIPIVKKKYPFLKKNNSPDLSVLSERNAFIVHEISGTIFSSTDVFLISVFCNLKLASVYSVYNMVFHSLSNLITTVNNSVDYILGQTYARGDVARYTKVHDVYETVYSAITFSLFTVAYLLVLPFVGLYTRGIDDIPYLDALLPLLFSMIQLLYCSKVVGNRLINISGHAKETQRRSIIEAGLNLGSSLILVNVIGIYGVLCGTIIALLYRVNDVFIYANHKILHRGAFVTYRKMLINLAVFAVFAVLEHLLHDLLMNCCSNYLYFILLGIIFTGICFILYFFIAIILEKDLRVIVKNKVLRRYL